MRRIILTALLLASSLLYAAEPPASNRESEFKNLTKDMMRGSGLELKALEIRSKIYEPQIIYVLDRTKIDIELKEEEQHFTPRIFEPIEDNRF